MELVQCPAFSEITLLTSTFMHGGLLHLGGNIWFLWIFGDNIEQKFGKIKYLGIYLIWGISAGLIHILGDPTSAIPAVGASGAISGVLGAYLMIFPRARIQTFHDAWFLLENDAHSGSLVLTILVGISKSIASLHWRVLVLQVVV